MLSQELQRIDTAFEYQKFQEWRRKECPEWTYEEWSAAYQGWLAAKRDAVQNKFVPEVKS